MKKYVTEPCEYADVARVLNEAEEKYSDVVLEAISTPPGRVVAYVTYSYRDNDSVKFDDSYLERVRQYYSREQ